MKEYLTPIFAILWKDVLIEIRTKDLVVSVLVFSLLVMVIFNFAIDPTPHTVGLVAPGVLWVAFVFGGILGLTRSFDLEKDQGSFHTLLLSPVKREQIYFGKMLTNFVLMLTVEALTFPIFAILFNTPIFVPALIPVALLSTLGIVTTGTLFSAMAVNTRMKEVMLPLLFLPVAVPAIIAAVESSGLAIRNEGLSGISNWLLFLTAIDALFLVICPIAFNLVVED